MAGDGIAAAGVVETEDADVAEVRGGDVVGFYQGGCRSGGGEADMAVRRDLGRGSGEEQWLTVVEEEGVMSHVYRLSKSEESGSVFGLDSSMFCSNVVKFLITFEKRTYF